MSRRNSRYVTIADQIISSLSNFVLVVFVARNASPTEFGQFSLGYLVLVFFLGFQRSLVGEVLLVRFSNGKMTTATQNHALGLTLLVGFLGAAVLTVGAFVAGPESDTLWFALAVSCIFVLLQDSTRYIFIAKDESGTALLLDFVWAVLSISAMLLLLMWQAEAFQVVLAWMGGAVVSLVTGLILVHAWPSPVGGIRLLSRNKDISVRFAAEFSSLNLSTTLVWFALAGLLGSAGVAALRGASLLFSPLNTGFNAVRVAMIPELIRNRSTTLFIRRMVETSAVLLAACLGWGVLVLAAPSSVGQMLLGSTWEGAEVLRWPNFVQAIAMVAYTVVLAYYRVVDLHKQSTRMRGVLAAGTLVVPLAVAVLFKDEVAVAWGFAVAVGMSAILGVSMSWMYLRKRRGNDVTMEVQ